MFSNPTMKDSELCLKCSKSLHNKPKFIVLNKTLTIETMKSISFLCTICYITNKNLLKRSVIVATVVGTILNLLNYGNSIGTITITLFLVVKMSLNYFVPFLVSFTTSFMASRSKSPD
ncbi:MAG TPA: hypothetical protein DEZ08_02130 [Dehalococcoidia bacterium]|jgi:hypothetical protein|nr:hypothetical protein [Dehalococcoidia bacterium]